MNARRVGLGIVGVLTALLGGASAAWACTGQPRVFTVSQAAAPQGTTVEARGEAASANTPIAIRWNELEGEVLGTGVTDSLGAFSVPITLPQAPPGIYSLVLTGDASAGRTTVEISAPGDAGGSRALAPAASWTSPAAGAQAANPFGPGMALGALFLGVGTVGLFAAFAVAAGGRRRRATAAPAAGASSRR